MNAEVDVSIARREDVMTIPVMALRTQRDLATTAAILEISPDELTRQINASGAGTEEPGPAVSPAAETLTLRGQTVVLPEGVSAEEVRAIMARRRSGETPSAEERQLMRKVFAAAQEAESSATATDYRFGGTFWVVTESEQGAREARAVQTGITDLDRVEVVSGLGPEDRVLILPSANLVETQERLQQFINRRVGTVPGMGGR
jgi:hypothetical protein